MRFEMWKSKAQKGAFLVLAALMVPVFFLFGALAMDLGEIWAYHSKMQNAVDAAALAGAGHFSEAKGDQILDSIDTANHKNADDNAKIYLSQNLGDSLDQLNAAESNHMLLFQAQKTDDSHSYYRVEYTKPIPLMFLRYLKIGDFNVKAAAVALLPSPGKTTGKVTFDNLVNVGTTLDGSLGNGAQWGRDKIDSASFDNGKVVVYDESEYNWKRLSSYYGRYYTSAAQGLYKRDVDGDATGKYYSNLTLGDSNDYDNKISAVSGAIESLFQKNANSVSTIYAHDNDNVSIEASTNTNYIHIISTARNFDINLSNGDGSKGSSTDPVYVYLDPIIKESEYNDSGLDMVHVKVQENIIRPVIFVYTEYYHGHQWRPWPLSPLPLSLRTKIDFQNYGHDFNGVLYAPYASADVLGVESGHFSGSIWFDSIRFQSNHGHFDFKEYGIPTSNGNSDSSSDSSGTALRLVPNDEVSWPQTEHPYFVYQ